MIDERTIELINGELDGDLTAAEQQELTGILEKSTEASDYRESWQRMHNLLEDVPGQDLPRDLHERITTNMQPPPQVQTTPAGIPAPLRYAIAASLGLMVAVGFYETRQPSADYDAMTGTMAPDTRVIDRYRVDTEGLSANATLARDNGAIALEVRLHSDEVAELAIDLAASGLRFDALTQRTGNLDTFSYAEQVLRVQGTGRKRFKVLLVPAVGAARDAGLVHLSLSMDGQIVQRGELRSN